MSSQELVCSSHQVPQQRPKIEDWAETGIHCSGLHSDSVLVCDGYLMFLLTYLNMRDNDISSALLNASTLQESANSSLT